MIDESRLRDVRSSCWKPLPTTDVKPTVVNQLNEGPDRRVVPAQPGSSPTRLRQHLPMIRRRQRDLGSDPDHRITARPKHGAHNVGLHIRGHPYQPVKRGCQLHMGERKAKSPSPFT